MLDRRSAAILMVDIAGYSRMVSIDEEQTVARMLRFRGETVEPVVARYGGQVVDYAGDGALIEFRRVRAAMRCAIAIHRELAQRERAMLPAWRFLVRIGLDMGEVLVCGRGISGQHVNIAARLQALAEPGGICLSGAVYAALGDDPGIGCVPGGRRQLRHITQAVDVWFWSPEDGTDPPHPTRPRQDKVRKDKVPEIVPAGCLSADGHDSASSSADQPSSVAVEREIGRTGETPAASASPAPVGRLRPWLTIALPTGGKRQRRSRRFTLLSSTRPPLPHLPHQGFFVRSLSSPATSRHARW